MILITCLFAFASIVAIVIGIQMMSGADRRALIRRRILEAEGMSDALDPSILREERMSSISTLNTMLNQLRLSRRLETLLVQAGLQTKVSVFMLMSLSLGLLVGVLARLLVHHPLLSIFLGTCAGLVPLLVVTMRKERRTRLFIDQFPESIDLMVSALRAGFALSGAIQLVADESPEPVSTEFRILFEEQKLGLDIRTALLNLAHRVDSLDVALFVTAVLIQRDTGGNLAEVLEKIADVIRDRFRILGEIRTFTAVGRLSGIILALLPPGLAFAITALNPDYMRVLLEHPAGSMLITIAIVLQVLGFLSIRRITDIKI